VFLIGLRQHLWAIVAWGGFLAFFGIFEANAYIKLTGEGLTAHVAFGQHMAAVGEATSLLIASPEHLETLAGYLEWFLFGYIPIFFSIWAMVAGTGALRGEEERGLVEVWLGAGVTRSRLVLERLAAFAVALVVAATMVGLGTVAGGAFSGQHDLSVWRTLLQGVAEAAPCLVVFALGMVASSLFPTRRDALGATSVVFIALLLLNGYSRHVEWLRPFRWISPFAYSDRTDVMIASGHFDVPATLALVVASLGLGALAASLLSRRDIGSALLGAGSQGAGPVVMPDRNPLLRWPAIAAAWDQRVGLLVWSLGLFAYGLIEMSIVKPFVSFFKSEPSSFSQSAVFGVTQADPIAGFIGATVYLPILVLLAAYAITQVSRWAAEDAEGRLEMVLSTGLPRWRVVVDRFLGLLVAAVVILVAGHLGLMAGARAYGLELSWSNLLLATVLILPVVVAFGALGSAIAAVRPRLAMCGLSGLVGYCYMVPLVAPLAFAPKPTPDWVLNISLFHLYGLPLTEGVSWSGLYALVAITAAGMALTFRSMARREVGS